MSATVTSPVAPDRAYAQRLAALDEANRIRSERAKLKAKLHDMGSPAGRLEVARLLAWPTYDIATMKVVELIIAAPTVGRSKANRWLRDTRISPSKLVGGLTPRQRAELAALVERR